MVNFLMNHTPRADEMFMGQRQVPDLNDRGRRGVLSAMDEQTRAPEAADVAAVDAGCFEGFFERHHARLYGTLRLVVGSAAEAEDVMQEAFLKVYERWDHVRVHPDPPAYLYRTAFNLHRNRLRSIGRAARRLFDPEEPADGYGQVEDHEDLMDALRGLSERQRVAVVLTELLDYPSDEAAAIMGVRPVTVRVLASQGRARLRERLGLPDDG